MPLWLGYDGIQFLKPDVWEQLHLHSNTSLVCNYEGVHIWIATALTGFAMTGWGKDKSRQHKKTLLDSMVKPGNDGIGRCRKGSRIAGVKALAPSFRGQDICVNRPCFNQEAFLRLLRK